MMGQTRDRLVDPALRKMQCNVNVEFKVVTLHEQVRYSGTLQY